MSAALTPRRAFILKSTSSSYEDRPPRIHHAVCRSDGDDSQCSNSLCGRTAPATSCACATTCSTRSATSGTCALTDSNGFIYGSPCAHTWG